MQPKRITELDSLRGLAAMSVLIPHYLSVYPVMANLPEMGFMGAAFAFILERTPLHVIYAGRDAVILFFILSGFVLALPFLSSRIPSYGRFLTRRVCRLYPAYVAAMLLAIVARESIDIVPLPGTTDWFRGQWTIPMTPWTILGYLVMSGFSHHVNINDVVWSLVHEMRISIVFPLLIAASAAMTLPLRLVSAFLASISASWAESAIDPALSSAFISVVRSLLETSSYLWCFVLGIELARHHELLVSRILKMNRFRLALLAIAASSLFTVKSLFPSIAHAYWVDFVTGFGAAIFVLLALSTRRPFSLLKARVPMFLGRISYSLYLLHLIVILAMVHAAGGIVPPWVGIIAAVFLSLLLAYVSFKLIEQPGIAIGRLLTIGAEINAAGTR
jgi:peptidoglycan/LPS O-acetylase OafA/YrhL